MTSIVELQAQLAELQKENEFLITVANLPTSPATDMWGRPRGPITDEERKKFKAINAAHRIVSKSEETTEMDETFALVAKIHNLREEISSKKKRARRLTNG